MCVGQALTNPLCPFPLAYETFRRLFSMPIDGSCVTRTRVEVRCTVGKHSNIANSEKNIVSLILSWIVSRFSNKSRSPIKNYTPLSAFAHTDVLKTGHPQRRFRPPRNHPPSAQRALFGRGNGPQSWRPWHDSREQRRCRDIIQHWHHFVRFRQFAPGGAPEQRTREKRSLFPYLSRPCATTRILRLESRFEG